MASLRSLPAPPATRLGTLAAGCLLALLLPAVPLQAQAPPFVPVQGNLYQADGTPFTGNLPVQFTVYADAARTQVLYGESVLVSFEGGAFSVALGPVDLSRFAGPALFVGINVNGDGEMDLLRVGTVPFAALASRASQADSALLAGRATQADSAAQAANAQLLQGLTPGDLQTATRDSLGPLANDNPRHHARYTDAEARSANAGLWAGAGHSHSIGSCFWTAYGCGEIVCPDNHMMVGMQARNNGNNEDCYGAGDYDEPSRRIRCCVVGAPR
jgi:hypothetical protein